MSKRCPVSDDLPAGAPVAGPRWFVAVGAMVASVILLTLAFAPVCQFYLAWVGLVPWLWLVHRLPKHKSAFWYSWLGGTLFFAANMWWLKDITLPGALGLVIYLGLYWAVAALAFRAAGLLGPGVSVPTAAGAWRRIAMLAAIWCCLEWLRGNLFTGLPWLFLGHTQTPALALCQIADATGAYGVTFWLVMVNATLVMLWVFRPGWRAGVAMAGPAAAVVIALAGYGVWRMGQATTTPGPRVLVVQANVPQNPEGNKGAEAEDLASFHIDTTRAALAKDPNIDLVVWSETMLPPMNEEARAFFRNHKSDLFDQIADAVSKLVATHHVALVAGGDYGSGYRVVKDRGMAAEKRNSAYFFTADGRLSELRYDKIHLVPFGEFMPFRKTFPPLYAFFELFNPYDFIYELTEGRSLTVFPLMPGGGKPLCTFVSPICFEDIDSALVAKMFRPVEGNSEKRASLLVNLTNDGWYKANENAQHLQVATFRSIENRVPTARAVNTGISGFIDSCGRADRAHLIARGTAGSLAATVNLDSRVSLYTRWGDWFPLACGLGWLLSRARHWLPRRVVSGR